MVKRKRQEVERDEMDDVGIRAERKIEGWKEGFGIWVGGGTWAMVQGSWQSEIFFAFFLIRAIVWALQFWFLWRARINAEQAKQKISITPVSNDFISRSTLNAYHRIIDGCTSAPDQNEYYIKAKTFFSMKNKMTLRITRSIKYMLDICFAS